MKKTALILSLAAVLGFTSCSQDEPNTPAVNDGNTTFTVQLPGNSFGSRAFSDGLTAENLAYAVYDANTNDLVLTDEVTFGNALQTSVSINLANGRDYNITFFAYDKNQGVYTFDTDARTISVDYAAMADKYNSDDFDCFYATINTGVVTAPINRTVYLYRPLAQINWGTSDLNDPTVSGTNGAYGVDAANLTTTMTVPAYTTLDVISGEVSGEQSVTFAQAARPEGEVFPVQTEDKLYQYLAMHYVLVPADKSVADAVLTIKGATEDVTVSVPNMPLQANYRTNVFGALLTNPSEFEVIKDNEYNKPDYDIYRETETLEALKDAIAAGFSVIVPKSASIVIDGPITLGNNQSVTINGTVETEGTAFVIPAGVESTINGLGDINFTYQGGAQVNESGVNNRHTVRCIRVYGKATIENVNMTAENHLGGNLIYCEDNSEVVLNNVVANTGYRALTTGNNVKLTVNGGEFHSTSHNGYKDDLGSAFAYTAVVAGTNSTAELNNVVITGIQGGLSIEKSCVAVLNNCDISTADFIPGDGKAFYAVYTAQGGDVTINSGKYYSPRYACYSGDNDITGDSFGSMALKGGLYSSVAWSKATNKEYPLPAGYKWVDSGDARYPFQVVAE